MLLDRFLRKGLKEVSRGDADDNEHDFEIIESAEVEMKKLRKERNQTEGNGIMTSQNSTPLSLFLRCYILFLINVLILRI